MISAAAPLLFAEAIRQKAELRETASGSPEAESDLASVYFPHFFCFERASKKKAASFQG